MKYLFTAFLFCLVELACMAQVNGNLVDRYPFVQRPTDTTITIAWRRVNAATSTLRYSLTSGVWTDSMTNASATQKPFFDLTGLQPNTKYYYQAYSVAVGDTFQSDIEYFYTAAPDTFGELDFLVYGDCGYNNATQNTVKNLMEQEDVDFGLVTGDVDQNVGDNYDDIFFGVYKDMLKHDCHFTCIGNHDTYVDNAQTYLDAFYLPSNNPANTERYYSFIWGDAKFISIDANIPYTVGSAQHNWLLDELRCNDRKWLMVFFHQPPWSNAWSFDYYIPGSPYFLYEGDEDMRTDFVPYFEQYGVDFVLNGHSHCYQRGDYNGIQYLITGGAGSNLIDDNTNSNSPNISVEIYENHYVKFHVNEDTAKYYMVSENGSIKDSVVVIKPYVHYEASTTSADASCFGVSDGVGSVIASGPKPPYTFLWDNGETTATATSLDAGIHDVIITDAVGCQRVESVTIGSPPEVIAQLSSSTGAFTLCPGQTLSLTASGGASYLWSSGTTDASFTVFAGGTYSVTAYDAAGCPSTPIIQEIILDQAPTANFIHGGLDGLMVAFENTGTGATNTFYWDFGDGNTDSSGAVVSHLYGFEGVFQVQLIVVNACGSDTITQTITVQDVAVQEVEAEQLNLQVQPNPFQDYTLMSFDNPKGATFSLKVMDVQGRLLQNYTKITDGQLRIDRGELSSGVYFYELLSEEYKVSGKLIVD